MAEVPCKQCGRMIPADARTCPYCGVQRGKPQPLGLIAAFFVIGALLGLLFVDSQLYEQWSQRFAEPQPEQAERPTMPANASAETPEAQAEPQLQYEPLRCNTKAAKEIRERAQELAEISEGGGVLHVRMRQPWSYYSPGLRHSFLRAFVESDSCLQGRPREIRFYYEGQEIALNKPPQGLRVYP